jgi:glycosyltransferase involved in cell wall biosynthesis
VTPGRDGPAAEILYVHSGKFSFVEIDRAVLAERWRVCDWFQPGRWPHLIRLVPAVLRADMVLGWFASWHTFFPITLAWLLRKPSLVIVGGFDTANMPDIGYGYQQGGLRKWASRWIMRRATRLVTNSNYSAEEIERNVGIPRQAVTVIHHGLPDPFGPLPADDNPEQMALTVGHLLRRTLEYKGHRAFVEAAALLPDVTFAFVGECRDDAIELLRARASENVVFTGFLPSEERDAYYRRAAVYVQASRHEGFGLAVAEAMLAGCIPVVVDATAMPEVVGDAGVVVPSPDPGEIAEGVRRALEMDESARRRARERVLAQFPLAKRSERLQRVVAEVLGRE